MNFELTKEFVEELKIQIAEENVEGALAMLDDLHAADIADIFDELEVSESQFIFFHLDPKNAANILVELEDEGIDKFLNTIPGSVIASELIAKMSSDDATDIIQHLPQKLQTEVLEHLQREQAGAIADLLKYDENTAGGMMEKELVKVNVNRTVATCMREIKFQANKVKNIFSVYVVDDDNILQGILPIQNLILNDADIRIGDIIDKHVITVNTDTPSEEVSNIMDKYGLMVLPVVDSDNRLKGRITIDDVVDVIREEAEKDYQLASGLAQDVESSDNVWKHTRARLPWLIIGMLGGIGGAQVISSFDNEFQKYVGLAMFLPLINGMAGNVGVQASSIVVQSIANQSIDLEGTGKKLLKELFSGLMIGSFCSSLLLAFNYFFLDTIGFALVVSLSLLVVITFASVFGTIVPMTLHRMKIDPALATGPFITTVSDIMGVFLYLTIARLFL